MHGPVPNQPQTRRLESDILIIFDWLEITPRLNRHVDSHVSNLVLFCHLYFGVHPIFDSATCPSMLTADEPRSCCKLVACTRGPGPDINAGICPRPTSIEVSGQRIADVFTRKAAITVQVRC